MESAHILALTPEELSWIEILKSDWQVLADLATADIILWLPTCGGRFIAAAMCRPATSATVHVDDVVNLYASGTRSALLRQAMEDVSIVRNVPMQWVGLYSVELSCVPVVRDGRCFAVLSLERNMAAPSRQTGDQGWTQDVAEVLCKMIASGEYPSDQTPSNSGLWVPRVIDGTILINSEGIVLEVSPNANSAMRRLGIDHSLVGRSLIEDITSVVRHEHQIEESLAVVVMGRAPWRTDVEAGGYTIAIRAVPLELEGERLGAVLLTRDVSELMRHEKQLLTKDATIREIHHRVKNNLQTVSALLRIQERRSDSSDVQEALREAGRRVESIAAVHEALSHNVDEIVDFDKVSRNILQMAVKVATIGSEIELKTIGEFGRLSADQALALATVLAELVANSVEHGYSGRSGTIWVIAERSDDALLVRIEDAGDGWKEGSENSGLGTKIVQAMVKGELGGNIDWYPREGGGTVASLQLRPETQRG